MARRGKGKQPATSQRRFHSQFRSWLIDALKSTTNGIGVMTDVSTLTRPRRGGGAEARANESVRQIIIEAGNLTTKDLTADEEAEDDGEGPSDSRKHDPTPRIAKLLLGLINSLPSVSVPILDAVFFLGVGPQKGNKFGFTLMTEILKSRSDRLKSAIQKFLRSTLQNDSKLKELRLLGNSRDVLYKLLGVLHNTVPNLVYPILPCLIPRLSKVRDVGGRRNATRFLSVVAASIDSSPPDEWSSVWEAYLNRYRDSDKDVRLVCAGRAVEILLNQPALRPSIWQAFANLLTDVSEDVRIQAVTTVAQVGMQQLGAVNEHLIHLAASRMHDKKLEVRKAATVQLMTLYKYVISRENCTREDRLHVASIAITSMEHDDMVGGTLNAEYRERMEKQFVFSVVPHTMEMRRRISTAVELCLSLRQRKKDPKLLSAFVSHSATGRRIMREAMGIVSDSSVPYSVAQEIRLVKYLKDITFNFFYRDVFDVFRGFMLFLAADQRASELVMQLIDEHNRSDDCLSQMEEILARYKEAYNKNEFDAKVLKSFLMRIAPMQFDAKAFEYLAKEVSATFYENDGVPSDRTVAAATMLEIIGTHNPHFLDDIDVVMCIVDLVECEHEEIACSGLSLFRSLVESDDNCYEEDWLSLVVSAPCYMVETGGGSPRVAKRALHLVLMIKGRVFMHDFIEHLAGKMIEQLKKPFENALATSRAFSLLGEVLSFYPKEYESTMRDLMLNTVIKEIIQSPESSPNIESGYEEGSMRQIPISTMMLVKVSAMKWCARVLLAMCTSSNESSKMADSDRRLGKQFIDLLIGIVERQGAVGDGDVSAADACWCRVTAGAVVMKLSHADRYSRELGGLQLMALAKLATDEVKAVRIRFGEILTKNGTRTHFWLPAVSLIPLLSMRVQRGADWHELPRREVMRNLESALHSKVRALADDSNPVDDTMMSFYRPEYVMCYLLVALSSISTLESHEDVRSLNRMIMPIELALTALKNVGVDLELVGWLMDTVRGSMNPGYDDEGEKVANAMKLWCLSEMTVQIMAYRILARLRGEDDEGRMPMIPTTFLKKLTKIPPCVVDEDYVPDEVVVKIMAGARGLRTIPISAPHITPTIPPTRHTARGSTRGLNRDKDGRDGSNDGEGREAKEKRNTKKKKMPLKRTADEPMKRAKKAKALGSDDADRTDDEVGVAKKLPSSPYQKPAHAATRMSSSRRNTGDENLSASEEESGEECVMTSSNSPTRAARPKAKRSPSPASPAKTKDAKKKRDAKKRR